MFSPKYIHIFEKKSFGGCCKLSGAAGLYWIEIRKLKLLILRLYLMGHYVGDWRVETKVSHFQFNGNSIYLLYDEVISK